MSQSQTEPGPEQPSVSSDQIDVPFESIARNLTNQIASVAFENAKVSAVNEKLMADLAEARTMIQALGAQLAEYVDAEEAAAETKKQPRKTTGRSKA